MTDTDEQLLATILRLADERRRYRAALEKIAEREPADYQEPRVVVMSKVQCRTCGELIDIAAEALG